MNWVNKQKLLAIEAIKYNNCPCLEIKELWQALHSTFNMAQDHHIVMGHLNTNNFIFYFSDFILIFFSCFFYFSFEQ